MELITLYARKEKLAAKNVGKYLAGIQTTITDKDGNIKGVFPVGSKQPRKGNKHITLNCWKYKLIWL